MSELWAKVKGRRRAPAADQSVAPDASIATEAAAPEQPSAPRPVRRTLNLDHLRLDPATPSNARSSSGLFSTSRHQSPIVDRFGECLPYADFNEQTNLFLIDGDKPGEYEGLGYVLELAPQTGANLELANAMLNIMSANAPAKTGIQFTLFGSPRIDRYLHRMVECTIDPNSRRGQVFPEQYQLLRRMAEQSAAYFKRGTTEPLHPTSNHRIRHFRGFFSVVYPTKKPNDQQVVRDVLILRETHISSLQQYFLYSHTWSIDDLLWWGACTLNPHRTLRGDSPVLNYDDSIEPRFQLIAPDTRVDVEPTRLDFYSRDDKSDAMSAICMSVRNYPQRFVLPQMGDLLGAMTNTVTTYPCPYTVTLGVEVPDYEAVKNKTLIKAASAQRQADLEIAKFMPSVRDVNEDWKLAQRAFDEGKGTLRMYLQLVLYAPPESANKVEEVARSVWRAANFELTNDTKIQQQAFISTLPMLNGPLLSGDLARARRSKTVTAYNAANLVPIIAEWTGTPPREREQSITPLLTFFGRRGQIMSVDNYANPSGNPNLVICGASGSGKSFLANNLITSLLATGGRAFVIDVGFSYVNLCQTLGGQYLEFDDKNDLCINPFDMIQDIEKDMPILQSIIALMCSQSPLSAYELSQLSIHIQSVYYEAQMQGRIPTITDVAESLKNNCELGGPNPRMNDTDWRDKVATMSPEERAKVCDPRIRDLGVQLYPFTEDGTYGRFFNRRTNVRFNSNFIVLELEQLKKSKHLQAVIVLLLMQLISYEVYQGDPSVKKLVLLDEAWSLLKSGEATADFIEEMYRRIRKAGGACCTATQSIADYSTSPAGQAALANADCIFLLRQKKDSIEALVQSKKLVLSEYDLTLLKSVTKTEQYSEAYIKIGDYPGVVGRLIVDPFRLLLYSTSPVDKAAIRAYREHGLSLADAIQRVLLDRGVVGVSSMELEATEEAV